MARKRKRKHDSYVRYIYKVLKLVWFEASISKRGMSIVNSFISDMFERLCIEAGNLVRHNKRSTLTARDVQTSVKLVLPDELAKHAVYEGTRALRGHQNFLQYKCRRRGQPCKTLTATLASGLLFPVGRIRRFMRQQRLSPRLGSAAPYYMAAVLEYLCVEIVDSTVNILYDKHCKRITPRHIQLAIRKDEELNKLFCGVTITAGGVVVF